MKDVVISRPTELVAYIKALGLTEPSKKIIRNMMALRGDKIRKTISTAYQHKGQETAVSSLGYLKALTFACSPLAVDGLEKIGMKSSIDALPLVADSHGTFRSFKSCLEPALRGGAASQAQLSTLLQTLKNGIAEESPENQESPPESAQQESEVLADGHGSTGQSELNAGEEPVTGSSSNTRPASPEVGQAEAVLRKSYHVYGASGAACFSLSLDKDGLRVNLEGASGSAQSYDWNSKINIQLNNAELPMLLGVLLGLLSKVEGAAHGPQRDKGFTIENQSSHLFISIRQKNRGNVSVKMAFTDCFWISAVLQSLLCKSLMVSETVLLTSLRAMANQINATPKS